MYRIKTPTVSRLKSVEFFKGEKIETKVKRVSEDGESIKDGAPLIYTERRDGVQPGYNIRTDRFEVATDAMDKISKAKIAARESKVIDMKPKGETGEKGGDVGEP